LREAAFRHAGMLSPGRAFCRTRVNFRADARERVLRIGLEAQHDHRRRVGRAHDARSDESVRAIVAAYKALFAQEAVLRSTAHACVSYGRRSVSRPGGHAT
jgi:hypothetical protein